MKLLLPILSSLAIVASGEPLALHPENPHYFQFRGKPTALVTSGEHYGAVLNLDFDYAKYLDTLSADGLNLTRTFSGSYAEPQGAFNIADNTLAPKASRFICPWGRSGEPGYGNGGNKFDLTKWDGAYFTRLKDFVSQADKRGVVVELNLFCPMYEDKQWLLSPMNAVNNVNGVGAIGRNDVHTLNRNGSLLAIQETMVRKIVAKLRDADNVYYEICNEPYFGGVTMEWQHHIADVIRATEESFPHRHLISQNVANGSQKIEKPHSAISIFNFHYANPPTAVAQNYGLNKVIGLNETGFKGTADDHYRMEAWEFLLAGGGLYNNLDYSFTAGHEDGTFVYPPKQPGGGNLGFRKQMKILKGFIHSFDFIKMKPARETIREALPKDARCQVLAESGRQYAVYFKGAPAFAWQLELPPGKYRAEWLDLTSGKTVRSSEFTQPNRNASFNNPEEPREVAVKILRVGD